MDSRRAHLLDETVALLRRRGRLSIEEVAAGAGVNKWFVHRLAQQAPHDFGVRKVQQVHDWLLANEDRLSPPARPVERAEC